jgi:hypothetical protein
MNLLAAHQSMDDKPPTHRQGAFRQQVDWSGIEAVNIAENQKTEASSIPWHPGAIKYFAEKGIKIK